MKKKNLLISLISLGAVIGLASCGATEEPTSTPSTTSQTQTVTSTPSTPTSTPTSNPSTSTTTPSTTVDPAEEAKEIMQAALDQLQLPTEATQDFTASTIGIGGVQFIYTSNKPNVLNFNQGNATVTRPLPGESDESVEVTVTAILDDYELQKKVTISVLATNYEGNFEFNYNTLDSYLFQTKNVTDSTYPDQFNIGANGYIKSDCFKGIKKIVAEIHGTFDNMKMYAGKVADKNTLITAEKVTSGSGSSATTTYTYTFDTPTDSFYFVNNSTYNVGPYYIKIEFEEIHNYTAEEQHALVADRIKTVYNIPTEIVENYASDTLESTLLGYKDTTVEWSLENPTATFVKLENNKLVVDPQEDTTFKLVATATIDGIATPVKVEFEVLVKDLEKASVVLGTVDELLTCNKVTDDEKFGEVIIGKDGGYITSKSCSGIYKIEAFVYGSYDNMKMYSSNTLDDNSIIKPTRVVRRDGNNVGYVYTYLFPENSDYFYYVNNYVDKNNKSYDVKAYYVNVYYKSEKVLTDADKAQTIGNDLKNTLALEEKYTLENQVTLPASLEGYEGFNITYALAEGSTGATISEGVLTITPTASLQKFTLVATATKEGIDPVTITFDEVQVKNSFDPMTFAEYIACKTGDPVTIKGVVVYIGKKPGTNSSGVAYTNYYTYLVDAAGNGYLAYDTKNPSLVVGKTYSLTGELKIHCDLYEVIDFESEELTGDAAITKPEIADITSTIANYATITPENQNQVVKFTGIATAAKTILVGETPIALYTQGITLNLEVGKKYTVVGASAIYTNNGTTNHQFYVFEQPMEQELTPEDKVNFTLYTIKAQFTNEFTANTEVTLENPYNLTLTVTVDSAETAIITYADGKITVTAPKVATAVSQTFKIVVASGTAYVSPETTITVTAKYSNIVTTNLVFPSTDTSLVENDDATNYTLFDLSSTIFDLVYTKSNTASKFMTNEFRFYKNDVIKISFKSGVTGTIKSLSCTSSYPTGQEKSLDYLIVKAGTTTVTGTNGVYEINDTSLELSNSGQVRFTGKHI